MSTTTTKLINPTDDELSAAVAEHVAGLTRDFEDVGEERCAWWENGKGETVPANFATSADAVLPLLDRQHHWLHKSINDGKKITAHYVQIDWKPGRASINQADHFCATEPTFPRAACIALLRANGIEVGQTAPAQK